MFVFTLLQSRFHVDTVLTIFVWLYQLKAHLLKSHSEGTWFRRNSATVVTLKLIYVVMKVRKIFCASHCCSTVMLF